MDFRGSGGEGAVGIPVTWPATGVVEVSFAFQPQTTDQNIYILAVQGDQRLFNSLPFERTGSLQGTSIAYEAGRWYEVRYRIDMAASTYRMFVDGVEIRSGAFERSAVPCSLAGGSYFSFHGGYVDQKWFGRVDDLRIEHRLPPCAPEERFALRFDGSGDEVELPMSLGDGGDRFTFEAWVRPTGTGGSEGEGGMIFTHRADCADFNLEWSGDADSRMPDRFRFRVYPEIGCGWAAAESGTPSTLGEWHHVAGVFDAGELRLYVDGALTGTSTLAASVSWSHMLRGHWIGRDGADGRPNRGAFVGEIDEVRVSRGARYAGTSFLPPAHLDPDAATVAAWLLDEGTGTTTQDASPGNYDGAVEGASWVRVTRFERR